mmetsp:Transcript_17115/g.49127  ORF Transcript_17115/g.49127 Transcript_17115/m.49127 type:complete len:202 (+) Transcript_17115:341-946(+)
MILRIDRIVASVQCNLHPCGLLAFRIARETIEHWLRYLVIVSLLVLLPYPRWHHRWIIHLSIGSIFQPPNIYPCLHLLCYAQIFRPLRQQVTRPGPARDNNLSSLNNFLLSLFCGSSKYYMTITLTCINLCNGFNCYARFDCCTMCSCIIYSCLHSCLWSHISSSRLNHPHMTPMELKLGISPRQLFLVFNQLHFDRMTRC